MVPVCAELDVGRFGISSPPLPLPIVVVDVVLLEPRVTVLAPAPSMICAVCAPVPPTVNVPVFPAVSILTLLELVPPFIVIVPPLAELRELKLLNVAMFGPMVSFSK